MTEKKSEKQLSMKAPADKSGKSEKGEAKGDVRRIRDIIKKLKDMEKLKKEGCTATKEDVDFILPKVRDIFEPQGMLVNVPVPVSICGDVHGQFSDVLRLFEHHGWPPKSSYLFMGKQFFEFLLFHNNNFYFSGDYVDRGPYSTQTILLMFSLKIRYPKIFYLLRGNHETKEINYVYGFKDEVNKLFPCTSVYKRMNVSFFIFLILLIKSFIFSGRIRVDAVGGSGGRSNSVHARRHIAYVEKPRRYPNVEAADGQRNGSRRRTGRRFALGRSR